MDGAQLYMFEPCALSVAEEPKHIKAEFTLSVGVELLFWLTVTNKESVKVNVVKSGFVITRVALYCIVESGQTVIAEPVPITPLVSDQVIEYEVEPEGENLHASLMADQTEG